MGTQLVHDGRRCIATLAAGLASVVFTHCSSSPAPGSPADGGTVDRSIAASDSGTADRSTREVDSGHKTHPEAGGMESGPGESGASDAGLRTKNCFASPGACGFPDPKYGNVGPSKPCASLTPSGSITVSKAGATIQDLNVTGSISVTAANVTIKNVCVSDDGKGNYNNGPIVSFTAPGGTIESSTVHGANATTQSVQTALSGMGTAKNVYLYNCGECIHEGPWTVTDSYILVNGADYAGGYVGDAGQGPEDHHEAVYLATSTFVGHHDTILNPFPETATIFGDTYNNPGGACGNHITVTDSLLAGSGYMFYTCGNGTSAGTSTMNISNNRFARCGTMTVNDPAGGGRACKGGPDEHGYFPFGGYFGVTAYTYCPPMSGQTWAGNVWDDDGHPVPCTCLASKAKCYSDSDCCSSTCMLTSAGGSGTCT
jgi:hypothetical protein